ncbi:MAG: hypothetical protein M3498_11120 [Deinococcota bacterium]|nr:hypothetical protein [Deinococcota bacterium]
MRRLLDDWSAAGRWWLGEPERLYFLVELENGWVAEVYREEDRWVLAALHD